MLISEIFPPLHGGSGRWFWEIYSRLDSGQYIFAVGHTKGDVEFDKTHSLQTCRINLSSNSWGIKSLEGLTFYWRTFWALRRLAKASHINQIHCGRCLPEGFAAYLVNKFYGTPYKCFIHGEDIESIAQSRELSLIVNAVFKKASMLICNSQNTKRLVVEKFPRYSEKCVVLHPGVDCEYFHPAEKNLVTRNQLGWADRPVVLTVGRLQERKGHDTLIKALPKIKQSIPDILYAIVGDGEQRSNLAKLTNSLKLQDHVLFMDEISDKQLVECYQQCELFVLPNRQIGGDIEGFGMVLVEAQACGKAVIAGDSGGTAETMIPEQTGVIVDCVQPNLLADKIVSLINDPNRLDQMGRHAREHVTKNLDWKALAIEAEKLFKT